MELENSKKYIFSLIERNLRIKSFLVLLNNKFINLEEEIQSVQKKVS